jgi:single-strand DNA-binding protein
MTRNINRVTLLGNLGRDAESHTTASGATATKFSVATKRSWKDPEDEDWKEETNWTNIVAWRQEKLALHLTKGKQVYVEGRLQTRDYEKDGRKVYMTEVVADQIILL